MLYANYLKKSFTSRSKPLLKLCRSEIMRNFLKKPQKYEFYVYYTHFIFSPKIESLVGETSSLRDIVEPARK